MSEEKEFNFLRFINYILPTLFAFVIGIVALLSGINLLFYDCITGVLLLVIGGIFIILGYIFKKTIPNKDAGEK